MKKFRTLFIPCVAVVMTATLSISTFAFWGSWGGIVGSVVDKIKDTISSIDSSGGSSGGSSSSSSTPSSASLAEQMASNSAAWHVANAAGDTKTMDKLHAANQSIAKQAQSSSYDQNTGSWTMTDSSGNTTTSVVNGDGRNATVIYNTTDSNNQKTDSTSSPVYTDKSIEAYKENGGTNEGLKESYNNTAGTLPDEYGTTTNKTSAAQEVAVAKVILGLTDEEAKQLQNDLEEAKKEYNKAERAYNDAVKNGDTAGAEVANEARNEAHKDAEEIRAGHNYSGDGTSGIENGGSYNNWEEDKPSSSEDFFTGIAQLYTMKATANEGGTISPVGTQQITEGNDVTYTMTAHPHHRIEDVLVDGQSVGAVSTYTFTDIDSAHTISAKFLFLGTVELPTVEMKDKDGNDLSNGLKSGYGISANLNAGYDGVTNVSVKATYHFGNGTKTTVLEESSHGVFSFPKNAQSPIDARCIYVPVETKDGNYAIAFTISATNADGDTISKSTTETIKILGDMYADDFTGDA